MAARGNGGRGGRGRGGRGHEAVPAPPAVPDGPPCGRPQQFFATLPLANWPLFLNQGPPASCLTCGHEPHRHLEAPALVAAPAAPAAAAAPVVRDHLLRQGPAPALPLAPGDILRALIADWRASAICSDDKEKWDKAFSDLAQLLFDPFSTILLDCLVAEGTTATTRRWSVRPDPPLNDAELRDLNLALRAAKDLGIAVVSILRLEARFVWKTSSAPMQMIDGDTEIPVAVFVAEQILRTSPSTIPGSRLPPAATITDARYPHWWGVLAATLPIEGFTQSLRDLYVEHVSAWCGRPENKALVTSSTAHRVARARRAADEATAMMLSRQAKSAGAAAAFPPPAGRRSRRGKRGREPTIDDDKKPPPPPAQTAATAPPTQWRAPQAPSAGRLTSWSNGSAGRGGGRGGDTGRGRF
jgi:hypothetical protein